MAVTITPPRLKFIRETATDIYIEPLQNIWLVPIAKTYVQGGAFNVDAATELGFYGVPNTAQPATPVDDATIIAALQQLGLVQ